MGKICMAFGAVLILVGVGFFVATGANAFTALIPAIVGLLILVAGIINSRTENPKVRMHSMHAAMGFGILGLLGAVPGVPKWIKHVSGTVIERPNAAFEQTLMFGILVIFMVVGVRSFIAARKAMKAEAA